MQFISSLMSVVIMAISLLVPLKADTQMSSLEKAQAVGDAVSQMFDGTTMLFEEETNAIMEAVVKNILIEAFTNESESEDLYAIIEKIPVFENGERDSECQDVTTGPFRGVFEKLKSESINSALASGAKENIFTMISEGVYELYVYFVPGEEEGLYVFCYDYEDSKGNVHTKKTNTRYNKNTGEFYSINEKGMLGFGFDFDVDNYLVTTPVYSWQRTFGYTILFDYFGEMGFMKTDMARIKFEHGGKHWMFQLWKGNYSFGLINGAEIGIYNKKSPLALKYDCASDEEMLDMSMEVFYNDELLIERDETRHWWLCGLRFGAPVPPEDLVFKGTIEFEDEEMMKKFIDSAAEYSDEMTISAEGNTVEYIWK